MKAGAESRAVPLSAAGGMQAGTLIAWFGGTAGLCRGLMLAVTQQGLNLNPCKYKARPKMRVS